jgi:hypothetical protein
VFKAIGNKSKDLIDRYVSADAAAATTAIASAGAVTAVMTRFSKPIIDVVHQYWVLAKQQNAPAMPQHIGVNYATGTHRDLAIILPLAFATGTYVYFIAKGHFEKYLR